MIAVVILLRVLAKCLSDGNKLSTVTEKVYQFAIGSRRSDPPSVKNNSLIVSGEKDIKIKLFIQVSNF